MPNPTASTIPTLAAARSPWLLPGAVLLGGMIVAVLAGWMTHLVSIDRSHQRFVRLCDKVSLTVSQRMQVYRHGLAGARGLFVASDHVNRREFGAYVASRDVHVEFPGCFGFGFVERVPRTGLERFVAETRADGAPNFTVRTEGQDDLAVIKYMEPFVANNASVGYDIATEAVRREAAERAMLSGEAALSGQIMLVHRRRPGLLYLLPVYRAGTNPTTPQERSAAIYGWVFTPLSIDAAMSGVRAVADGMVEFDVFDGAIASEAAKLYEDHEPVAADGSIASAAAGRRGTAGGSTFQKLVHLRVGQRDWTLRVSTTPAFEGTVNRFAAWQVAGTTTVLSALVSALVWSLGRARRRAIVLAREMTAALKASEAQALAVKAEVEKQAAELTTKGALLEEARAAAEAASKAKSDFLANMSHEIRTPMGAIVGYADLMMDPAQTAEQRNHCVQVIRRNGEHLLTVLNDILDVSKIESQQMAIERIDCSPCAIVADVASLMRPRAVETSLAFTVHYEGAMPRTVRSDPTRLRQILLNLLSNAIKFTPVGSVDLIVRLVKDGHREHLLQFQVRDSGIGMTAEQQASLFRPFTQADVSTTRKYGGTGLGLVISQRLARMLGGTLTLASAAGVGTTFSLALPVGDLAGVPMEQNPSEASRGDQLDSGERPQHVRVRGRILLAEDGADNRRLVCVHLATTGAEVATVVNGAEAVEHALAAQAAGRPFDMILMDMQMPELDGYGAASALRAKEYRGPIVALTAHAMSGDREKCLMAGCDDYMTKPVDRGVLLGMVAKYLPAAPDDAGQTAPPALTTTGKPEASCKLLSEYASDPEMKEALVEFTTGLHEHVALMGDLLRGEQFAELRDLAHTLKGAGGGYGFPQITTLAASLEGSLKARADLATIRASVESLAGLIRSVEGYSHPPEAERV